jgi:hypothetical protein
LELQRYIGVDGGVLALPAEALNNLIKWLNISLLNLNNLYSAAYIAEDEQPTPNKLELL